MRCPNCGYEIKFKIGNPTKIINTIKEKVLRQGKFQKYISRGTMTVTCEDIQGSMLSIYREKEGSFYLESVQYMGENQEWLHTVSVGRLINSPKD
jgi:hypothetical protein